MFASRKFMCYFLSLPAYYCQRFISIYTHECVDLLSLFWPQNCPSHSSPIFPGLTSLAGETNSLSSLILLEAASSGLPSLLLTASLRLPPQKSESWGLLTQHMLIKQCADILNLIVWELSLYLSEAPGPPLWRSTFPFYHLPTAKLETLSCNPDVKQK